MKTINFFFIFVFVSSLLIGLVSSSPFGYDTVDGLTTINLQNVTLNATNMSDLGDVNAVAPTNNFVLTFNGSSGFWEPKSASAVGDTDTHLSADADLYLFNSSTTISFNDTLLNNTIDDRTTGITNNSAGWTLNISNLYTTLFYTLNSGKIWHFWDDGTDLFLNVTNGGGSFFIETENSKIELVDIPAIGNDFKVFQVFNRVGLTTSGLGITQQGPAHTSYITTSFSIPGNVTTTPSPFNCSSYANYIDCNTDITGPDFYVQDDVEIAGHLYVGEGINVSDWTNVTITESQISDLVHTADTDTQKGTSGFYVYNNSGTIFFNETFLNGTIDNRAGDNASWNQSFANSLYADISVIDTDTQKTTDGLYLYNNSGTIFYNETKLNETIDNRDSDTTYNTECSAGDFILNLTPLGGVTCGTPAGSGDITDVQGDGVFIYNGSTSGAVNLLFNKTPLNNGITLTEANITDLTHTTDTQKTTSGDYIYNNSNTIFFNESFLNNTIDNRAGDNSSWNQSFANSLYADISVIGDNASWNQSLADTLYSTGSHTTIWDTAFNISFDQRDSDTTYTSGSNLSLVGTIFSANMTQMQTFWDTLYSTGSHTIIWNAVFNTSFSNRFDSLFTAKDTDDLSQGTTSFYDNVTWNQSQAGTLYEPIGITESDISDLTHTSLTNVAWQNQTNVFTPNQNFSANITLTGTNDIIFYNNGTHLIID